MNLYKLSNSHEPLYDYYNANISLNIINVNLSQLVQQILVENATISRNIIQMIKMKKYIVRFYT